MILHHETIPSISGGCLMLTTRSCNIFEWIDDLRERPLGSHDAYDYMIYLGSTKRVRGAYEAHQYVRVLTSRNTIGWVNLQSLKRIA